MNTYTESLALSLAHVALPLRPSTEDLTDRARAAGVMHLCLGCGCTVAMSRPPMVTDVQFEMMRDKLSRGIDWDADPCCPDADAIRY